jgi:hypothetical protein
VTWFTGTAVFKAILTFCRMPFSIILGIYAGSFEQIPPRYWINVVYKRELLYLSILVTLFAGPFWIWSSIILPKMSSLKRSLCSMVWS